MSLREISGLGAVFDRQRESIDTALTLVREEVLGAFSGGEGLCLSAPPALEVPDGFGEMLAAALALDEISPASNPSGGGAVLRHHYLRFLPTLHMEQRQRRGGEEERILHAPLLREKTPMLRAGIDRLFALFGEAGVPGAALFGAGSAAALLEECPDLRSLYDRAYYGRYLPLLATFPSDLRRLDRQVLAGRPAGEVIDEYLAAPVIHELSHAARRRRALSPPYLDECIASYVGVLALPGLAYPEPGCQALFAAPWLAQVGQALARVAGRAELLRAHAGLVPWGSVLPPALVDALLRAGWDEHERRRAPHFLASNFSPGPWLKLIFLGAAGGDLRGPEASLEALARRPFADLPVGSEDAMDQEILGDALRSACLRASVRDGAYLVESGPGVGEPLSLLLDLRECQVRALRPPATECVDPSPTYLFPPAVAARLRGRAGDELALRLFNLKTIPEVVARLLDGGDLFGSGAGYSLSAASRRHQQGN